MHRSGTSALNGALSRMGLFVGESDELTGTSWENPEGFFERRDARGICDALLHGSDADWWKVSGFDPDIADFQTVARQRPAIRDLVKRLDESGRSWALKEPRLCLLMPIFRSMLRRPFALITVRHPMEVARSLRRRNGFPIRAGLALWEAYTLGALRYGREVDHHILTYEHLLTDPLACFTQIARRLADSGADPDSLDPEAAASGIDTGLRREYAGGSSSYEGVPAAQRALYEAIEAGDALDPLPRLSDESVQVLKEFEQAEAARIAAAKELEQTREKLKERSAQKSAAEEALQKATRRVDELKSQITDQKLELEEKLGAARSDAEASKKRLTEIESARSDALQKLEQTNKQLSERTAQKSAAEEALQKATRRVDELKSQITDQKLELEEKLGAARSDAEALKKRLTEIESARSDAVQKLEQTNKQLSERTAQRSAAEEALKEALRRTQQLEEQAASRAREFEAKLAASRSELELSSSDLKRAESELAKAQAAREISDANVTQLEASLVEAKDQLVQRADAEAALREENAKLDARVESLTGEIATLQETIESQAGELGQIIDARDRLADDLKSMKSAALERDQRHKSELADKAAELTQLTQALELARSEVARARDHTEAQKQEIAQKQALLDAAQARAEEDRRRHGAELSEQKVKAGNLSRDLAGKSAELKQLKQALEDARGQLAAEEAKQNGLWEALAEKTASLEAEKSELSRVRADAKALKLEISQNKATLEAALGESATVRSEVTTLKRELSDKSAALIAASGERSSFQKESEALKAQLAEGRARTASLEATAKAAEQARKLSEEQRNQSERASLAAQREAEALREELAALRSSRAMAPARLVGQARKLMFGNSKADTIASRRAALSDCVLFDAEWYLRINPDIAQAGMDPLDHYLSSGDSEGRDPHPLFRRAWYLRANGIGTLPAGVTALEDYLSSPRGRSPHPLFDPAWYAAQDGAASEGSELADYLTLGWEAGRQPNEIFDPVWYMQVYPDVKRAGIEPLRHYIGTGAREGRDPGPAFANTAYREAYRDVRLLGVESLEHYLVSGKKEGRIAGVRHR